MLYNRLYDVYYIEALGGRGKIHPRRPFPHGGESIQCVDVITIWWFLRTITCENSNNHWSDSKIHSKKP